MESDRSRPATTGRPSSANGGYTCGLLAGVRRRARRGDPARPRRRSTTPMRFDGTQRCVDGETLVAEAKRDSRRRRAVPAASRSRKPSGRHGATRASTQHEYPTCFVCGPDARRRARASSPARSTERTSSRRRGSSRTTSRRVLVWAALDCPGAIGVGWDGRGDWLLGRMAAEVARACRRPGERCVVVAWPLGHEGRKGYAGTALYRGDDAARAGAADLDCARVAGTPLAPQPDRVQVVGEDLRRCAARAPPAGRAPRGGSGPLARRSGPTPARARASARTPAASTARRRGTVAGHLRPHEPRADREDRDPCPRAGPRASRRSARRRPCSRSTRSAIEPGRYAAPLAVITIRPRPRSIIPGIDRAAAEVDAEHVDLVDAATTPSARTSQALLLPERRSRRSRRAGRSGRARARSRRPSARRPRAWTRRPRSRAPPISRGDLLDLRARARRDRDAHPRPRQLAGDVRADAAAAAGDERDRRRAQTAFAISSRASGFSSDDRSPGSLPSTFARTARRTIFAERVFGSEPTNTTRSGLNALPSASATAPRDRPARRRPRPGERTQKIHATSPFTSCGTPTAAASATPGCDTAADSSSAGPMRLPGDVERVVGAPVQEPVAVLVDGRPVAVRPHAGEAAPVRLEVALRVAPEPARHARERPLADELADLAADGVAVGVEHVHVLAERGEAERARA